SPIFSFFFFFYSYDNHRALHSFPTRRSSDLFTSGWASPVYIDCRKLIFYPRLRGQLVDFAVATLARDVGFEQFDVVAGGETAGIDRKSTRLNSSHLGISYAVFCLKKKKKKKQ